MYKEQVEGSQSVHAETSSCAWLRLTLWSEARSWAIRLLFLAFPFLCLTCSLQAGKLLMKVAAHTRSSCTIQDIMSAEQQQNKTLGIREALKSGGLRASCFLDLS